MLTRILLSLAFSFSLSSCANVQDDTGATGEIDAVNDVVLQEFGNQNVVGGAVAVVRNGKIIHAKGYGHTTLARDIPVTADTVFRWASLSKTLTAVAALQLDETSSAFSIEDRVNTHVDDWPAGTSNKSNITVKQLLSHRAGIIHYRSTSDCPENTTPDYDWTKHGDSMFNAANAVDVFSDEAICFTPGSGFKYSTFGFSLAAAALEAEAKVSYAQWVQDTIAVPLNMRSLSQATGESNGFKLNCGELVSATEGSKSYVLPGGGWASNITDLAKFANGLLQQSLLNDTARLWTAETGNSNSYRLGISISSDGQRAWHAGAHSDLVTFMHLYHGSSDNVGIVVYLNNADANAERVAKAIANTVGVANWSDLGPIPTGSCSAD